MRSQPPFPACVTRSENHAVSTREISLSVPAQPTDIGLITNHRKYPLTCPSAGYLLTCSDANHICIDLKAVLELGLKPPAPENC